MDFAVDGLGWTREAREEELGIVVGVYALVFGKGSDGGGVRWDGDARDGGRRCGSASAAG